MDPLEDDLHRATIGVAVLIYRPRLILSAFCHKCLNQVDTGVQCTSNLWGHKVLEDVWGVVLAPPPEVGEFGIFQTPAI